MCSWNNLLAKSSSIGINSTVQGATTVFKNWLSSNTASIARINRRQYLRQYPTLLVNPDGSTITIRYHEPRKIIKLPLDLSKFSEEERKVLLERRKPKTTVKLEEDVDEISFDSQKYLKFVTK